MSNPNGTKFAEGELVNVSIRGARVVDGALYELSLDLDTDTVIDLPWPHRTITVERVAPAEWPPQIGDVWADRDGREWFCGDSDGETILMSGVGLIQRQDALDVLADYGPIRLVRRRGWTPTADTTPAEPKQVKVSYADGLRAMADWIDDHPEMHAPYSITHRTYAGGAHGQVSFDTLAELDQVAARFGVRLEDHDVQVRGTLPVPGGSSITIVWFAPEPTATQPDEPAEDDRADADPEAPVPAPAAAPSIDDDAFDATCGPMPPAGRLFEGALKSPVEWLTEYPGTQILDWDGWHDKDVTEPISHAEFHQRLMQCTITGPAKLPHRTPDPDAASLLAQSLADGAA